MKERVDKGVPVDYDNLADGDLVRAIRSGYGQASRVLVDRYLSDVYAVAMRVCGNAADAEDITQDAFLRAFERLGQYDPQYSFRNWLLKIAINLAISHLRSVRREGMARRQVGAAVILVGMGSMGWAASPTEPVKFKFKHEVGRVTRLRIVTKSVGSIKLPEPMPEQKFSQTFGQDYQMTCKKVNADGTGVYEATMPRIEMKTGTAGFTMDVLAEAGKATKFTQSPMPGPAVNPATEGFGKIFSAMTDVRFTLITDADGKPIRIEGFAESMNKVFGKMEGLGIAEKAMLNAIKGSLNDETMMGNMKDNYRIAPPGNSARVGDTWKREAELKMPFLNRAVKNETTYTLLGVETVRGRNCAKIGVREVITTLPLAKPSPTSTSPAGTNLLDSMECDMKSNDGQGVIYVDCDTGDMVQLRKTARMVMVMTMKNLPGVNPTSQPSNAAPFRIEQKLNTSVIVDLVDPDGKLIGQQ